MKEVIIFVEGLGCSEVNLNKDEMFYKKKFRTQNIVVMCNKSLYKTVRNIGGTVCDAPPSKTNPFVIQVFRKVIEYMNNGYYINLVGYSYGGAVVSRVAQMIPNNGQIKILTAGSIYAPNIPGVTHLMFKNDVALRCNGLNPIKDRYIRWLVHSNFEKYKPKRYKLFGSKKEWEIHTDYFPYIYNILKKPNANMLNKTEMALSRLGIFNSLQKYVGGGSNGRVFETNNGSLIKIVNGNNPMEYEALKIMNGSGITPRLKKFKNRNFNSKVTTLNNNNIRFKMKNLFNGRYVTKVTVFKMNKINANRVITMKNFLKENPRFNWIPERERLLDIIHSRGLTHGDFHLGNILVSLKKGKPPRFWAIDFGRSVRLPAGVTEKSLFNIGYYGRYYGKHAKQKMYQTKSNRLVKPNYQTHNNLSKANIERAKKYKYLPNLNYMRKFGVVPLKINKKEPLQVYRKRTIRKEPRLRKFNAPRIKPIRLNNNVNLQNYLKLYRKIITQTNVPGAYGLRKKLLSNLSKKLTVHDYIAANNFKPHEEKEFYYLPLGKNSLYLLPESYERLKKSVGNSSFNHFILRNKKILLKNFKRVSK